MISELKLGNLLGLFVPKSAYIFRYQEEVGRVVMVYVLDTGVTIDHEVRVDT